MSPLFCFDEKPHWAPCLAKVLFFNDLPILPPEFCLISVRYLLDIVRISLDRLATLKYSTYRKLLMMPNFMNVLASRLISQRYHLGITKIPLWYLDGINEF